MFVSKQLTKLKNIVVINRTSNFIFVIVTQNMRIVEVVIVIFANRADSMLRCWLRKASLTISFISLSHYPYMLAMLLFSDLLKVLLVHSQYKSRCIIQSIYIKLRMS